jgi:hypothetical protein
MQELSLNREGVRPIIQNLESSGLEGSPLNTVARQHPDSHRIPSKALKGCNVCRRPGKATFIPQKKNKTARLQQDRYAAREDSAIIHHVQTGRIG